MGDTFEGHGADWRRPVQRVLAGIQGKGDEGLGDSA